MMKLDKTQREARKELRDMLETEGGEVFSFPNEGLTVVVVPATGFDEAEADFAHVTVAQCDFKDDEVKRKVGEFIALNRWAEGLTFAVPYLYRDNEEIAEDVRALMVG